MKTPRTRTTPRIARTLWLVLAVFLSNTACADTAPPAGTESPDGRAVHDLHSIQALQDRFEQDTGKVRLILLISPT